MTVTGVVLHLGMGKTGSSSLQVAFVRNRDRLARMGIRYPEHRTDERAQRGQANSGNGMALRPYLAPKPDTPPDRSAAALDRLLREVETAPETTVAYSSEFLFYFDVERLRELHARLAERGVGLRAVMYVRDVAGHALSSYAQEVKRSLYVGSITDYLRGYALWPADMSMGPRLQALTEVLGVENCVVVHYDSVRNELLESFMGSTFGVSDLDGFELGRETVNRSLTAQEVEWMRYVNAHLEQPSGARAVSDQIISREPLDPRRLVVTHEELALLEDRFGEEVAWINETFFPDGRLSVRGGADIVEERDAIGVATQSERFLLECLAGLGNDRRSKQNGGSAPAPPIDAAGAQAARRAVADGLRRRVRRRLDRRSQTQTVPKTPGGAQ